jgi:nucleoid-associated protein YgaU
MIPCPLGRGRRTAADEGVYRQSEADLGGCVIHVVKRYETLESIARDRLGDPSRAREIAALNQDLLSDANRLKPGMRLLLPSFPTSPRRGS